MYVFSLQYIRKYSSFILEGGKKKPPVNSVFCWKTETLNDASRWRLVDPPVCGIAEYQNFEGLWMSLVHDLPKS